MSFLTSVCEKISKKAGERSFLAFAFIFLIGLLIRTSMLLSPKSFWGDEWFSIDLALRPLSQTVLGAIHDVHPPLFYVLLHAFIKLLGQHEWVFRLPSYLASAGIIVTTWLIAKKTLGTKTALICAWLTAASPYWLQLSNEVRSYSLLGFTTSLALVFLLQSLQEPRRKSYSYLYVFFAVMAVYVEHYSWFWVFAVSVFLAIEIFTKQKTVGELLPRQIFLFLLIVPSLGLILFQALYYESMFDSNRVKAFYAFVPLVKNIGAIFWQMSSGPVFSMLTVEKLILFLKTSPFFCISGLGALLSTALGFYAFVRLLRERLSTAALIFFGFFFPVLFLGLFYPVRLDARYLSFAAPFFYLLVANGLARIRSQTAGALALVFLSVISAVGDRHMIQLKTDAIHKEDYRGMVRYAFSQAEGADAVAARTLHQAVVYYLHELNLKDKAAPYFASLEDFMAGQPGRFERVWILDYIDMDPAVNDRNLSELSERLKAHQFYLARREIRFGGPEGLTAVHVFQRSLSDGADVSGLNG